MYTQEVFTEFGYVTPAAAIGNDREITYGFDENLKYGRYCKSAIAVIDAAANTMTCVKISEVTSNLDAHATSQQKPAKCLYTNGDEDACKYMYKDKAGDSKLLQQEYCQCSLMEEITDANKLLIPEAFVLPYSETKKKDAKSDVRERIELGNGFCPLATQEELDTYVKNFKPLVEHAIGKLHTNDRANLQAMSELVGDASSNAGTEEEKTAAEDILNQWNNTVITNFKIEFWPYIQSNQTNSCVNIVMANSPDNLMKLLGGERLKYYKGLAVFSLAVLLSY